MDNKPLGSWGYIAPWLRLLVIIILGLGIFFRVVNIDRKIYWHDETATSLRIAGYSKNEFVRQAFNGQPTSVEKLMRQYQSLTPERNLDDTIKAFMGRPEHPPLYYLMARFWAQGFGTSVAAMRSLPVLISLLAFPAIYWLCLELFESSLVGWMAVALIAVSPVHVLYAQEAREYSLWTVAIVLSSAALLQAIRLKTVRSWAIYAAMMALGLYSHLLFVLIALGHGIYVAVIEGFRLSRTAIAYLLASLAGLFAFLPWLWVMVPYFLYSPDRNRVTEGVNIPVTLSFLVSKWLRNINRGFHDANLGYGYIILFVLAAYAIYFVCRRTPRRIWLFILTLTGVTALALALPDLILGGQRSIRTRYFFPCYLGIQLALAYLFATQITTARKWRQQFWQVVTLLVLSIGIVSGVISSQAQVMWSKNISVTRHFPKIAERINEARSPLVISDGSPTSILSLSYLLEPNVTLQLVKKSRVPDIPPFTEIFLFDASKKLRERLQQEKNYSIESIAGKEKAELWKVSRR